MPVTVAVNGTFCPVRADEADSARTVVVRFMAVQPGGAESEYPSNTNSFKSGAGGVVGGGGLVINVPPTVILPSVRTD